MLVTALGHGDARAILELQRMYNLIFPPDYIDFLSTMNGVISQDETSLLVDSLGQKIEIDSLFGINPQKSWLDVGSWMKKYARELPSNALVIGCDLLNNLIVMINAGENAGVYYWDSSYSFASSTDASNAYLIADSFKSFREKLGDFIERM